MKYVGIALLVVLALIVLLLVIAALKAVKIKAKPLFLHIKLYR